MAHGVTKVQALWGHGPAGSGLSRFLSWCVCGQSGGWVRGQDGKLQGHLLVLSRALRGAEEEGTAHPASAERFAKETLSPRQRQGNQPNDLVSFGVMLISLQSTLLKVHFQNQRFALGHPSGSSRLTSHRTSFRKPSLSPE